MPLLGAHMSIAGGFYKAVEAAADLEMDVVQIFTNSPSQWVVKQIATATKGTRGKGKSAIKHDNVWEAKELGADDVAKFRESLERLKITHPISHSSYLINLASPDEALRQKSIAAFVVELERATALGIPWVVLHPGAHTSVDEETGLELVVDSLNQVHQQTTKTGAQCCLETTAGQGSCLGWRFEHLGEIIRRVDDGDRLGVCVDTCHIFAAGYPLSPRKAFRETISEFDRLVGIDRIQAFHLNDSKREIGSRVDRHEHIGEGKLGLEPFGLLLNDSRFRRVPMYLETPKGKRDGEELDAINLRSLRSLVT